MENADDFKRSRQIILKESDNKELKKGKQIILKEEDNKFEK